MRTTPVLAALLVAFTGLAAGTVGAAPTAEDATHSGQSLHDQMPAAASNVSFDRLVLAEASAMLTVDEVTVDRIETKRGTVEDVTLQDATIMVDDATVVVSNLSTKDGDLEHAFVTIEEGEVTVEEATAMANGDEFTIESESMAVENVTMTSGGLDGAESVQLPVDADELKQLLEGASVEDLSIDGVSADADIVLASVEGVQADDRSGFGYFGDVTLESFEGASVMAESASIQDGMLVLEGVMVSVEQAQVTVDIGVMGMDGEIEVHDNMDIAIDGPVTFERDELRIPLR